MVYVQIDEKLLLNLPNNGLEILKLNIDPSDDSYSENVDKIHALSNSERLKVFIELLNNYPALMTTKELSNLTDIKKPNIRFHLKVLKSTKLVNAKKRRINSHVYKWEYQAGILAMVIVPNKEYWPDHIKSEIKI